MDFSICILTYGSEKSKSFLFTAFALTPAHPEDSGFATPFLRIPLPPAPSPSPERGR